jgi:Flp pilus assembly protein TadG
LRINRRPPDRAVRRTHTPPSVHRLAVIPATALARFRRRPLGQSLVELAIVLPLLMLLLVVTIDFGRVFLGWIELNNVAREAANFAAQNPTAWNTVNPDASAQARYQSLVTSDAASINCTLPTPNPAPTPSFVNGPNGANGVGQPVRVSLTCSFHIITPIVSSIIANPLPVSASAAFPIQFAAIPGIPTPTPGPTATPAPTPTPTQTPGPTPTPTPTSVPTPSPTPMCTVPDFTANGNNQTSKSQSIWGTGNGGAGFQTTVIFSPLNPTNGSKVTGQSLTPGQSLSCVSTAITLTWK